MTIRLVRTYFTPGGAPKFWKHRFELNDTPTSGFARVLMIEGEKRCTLLCPHTLWTGQVSRKSGEFQAAEDVELDPEKIGRFLTQGWEMCARLGFQREYGVAALALTELGQPVPKFLPPPSASDDPDRKRGGKPIDEAALKPCRRESKRGRVAEFFLDNGMQSLHEAMARLGLTRSGVLSHLFTLNRDHGVGYELVSDCAQLLVPDGFDLFDYKEPERAARPEQVGSDGQPPRKRTGGKPIVVESLRPIPEPSKRATVARLFVDGWHDLADACATLGLDRSAVLSHLFTINKENGLGYEMSEDSKTARLLLPEGHVAFGPKPPRVKREPSDG